MINKAFVSSKAMKLLFYILFLAKREINEGPYKIMTCRKFDLN